jgi:hypothetical protein
MKGFQKIVLFAFILVIIICAILLFVGVLISISVGREDEVIR